MHKVNWELLSRLVDGDLSEDETKDLQIHLAACSECARAREELETMKVSVQELGAEPPARDLWPDIEEAVLAPGPLERVAKALWLPRLQTGPQRLLAAAAVLVLLVIGALRLAERGGGSEQVAANPSPTTVTPAQAALADIQSAKHAYLRAIEQLETASAEDMQRLPPRAREDLATALVEVDRAIENCERAIAGAPEDPFGQTMLLALYEEKVRVLTAALSAADMMRSGT